MGMDLNHRKGTHLEADIWGCLFVAGYENHVKWTKKLSLEYFNFFQFSATAEYQATASVLFLLRVQGVLANSWHSDASARDVALLIRGEVMVLWKVLYQAQY